MKGFTDRSRRHRTPIHVVATGSSALNLASGSPESLAGRFERVTLSHRSVGSMATVFHLDPEKAADFVVRKMARETSLNASRRVEIEVLGADPSKLPPEAQFAGFHTLKSHTERNSASFRAHIARPEFRRRGIAECSEPSG